jgi:putative CocE/NonD family hydrolase
MLFYYAFIPVGGIAIIKEESETYIKSDSVTIKMPDGGTISLVIARDKKATAPQPVILKYNIYANAGGDMADCKYAVHKGYVGIVANTRGKRLSPDSLEPLEHDAYDAYYIIDWISKQPWCNGKVGMYGGSYLGFSQWAAVKHLHPALKTIVPQVAVGAGIDFPMQNGIYQNYVLRWLHYVMDNKFTNEDAFDDTAKWNVLYRNWYKNGNSLRSLDTLEGRPNSIFHRWLQHPAYDSFWQQMTPQKEEFAKINIPILTTTGYWDDDQLGAMYYYRQYQKYNKNQDYYLLIGPYDHGGSQGYPKANLEGYRIDSTANIVVDDVVFQWFDYVLKGAPRPALLQDKVNFEVMGENKWHHVATLDQMHNDTVTLYMGNIATNGQYPLLTTKPKKTGYIEQSANLADRSMIYPKGEDIDAFPSLIDSVFKPEKGKLVFISPPVDKPYAISGAFAANLLASINKKDMDLVVDLYEQTPDGKFMALSENLQRASFIKDRRQRHLLTPGKIENINLKNTYITSRLMEKGSRIIILLGINKYPEWQINYGTGKDVSDETIKDAAVPLKIKWYNGSCIKLPVLKEN